MRASRARGNDKLQSRNCYIHVSTNEDQNNSIAVELKILGPAYVS